MSHVADQIAEARKDLTAARLELERWWIVYVHEHMDNAESEVYIHHIFAKLIDCDVELEGAIESELRRPDPEAPANLERLTRNGGRDA